MSKYRSGVLFGKELEALYNDAKANNFAIPAVNTTGTDTINASNSLPNKTPDLYLLIVYKLSNKYSISAPNIC